jgi:hypothetical protein
MKITDSLMALTQDRVGQVLVVQSDLQATRDAVCAMELCVVEVQRRLDSALERCMDRTLRVCVRVCVGGVHICIELCMFVAAAICILCS